MANLSRADKISNIAIALMANEQDSNLDKFKADYIRTSLIGPNIVVTTASYTGVVTASFDTPVITLDIQGVKQRFADIGAFLVFFRESLKPSRPATNTLAAALPNSTRVGNSVIFERNGVPYLCVEQNDMFDVRYNNQKMSMTHDDILMVFG
uniref:Virion structural protein n=1 Tax=Pseudomonas phage HRDY3 TaxID=3236930 RepID=A0AB39CE61_9VIRU